ncbi:hypothetical protein D9Q98_008534 [Chlorella vulgaris]|uniref:Fluoride ion transporter CrcB n=1 Tax=Chlorella vulgaris TaxID=3077 RepID=A0A9D4TI81_CHLVU|nr:hypothetical protein D9Q98_008534 [Chlorella vulgaris]
MVRKHESSTLRLIVTLIHLTLGAQLGVLTRTFLSKLFVLGCGGGWGPCLQGSIYFKDLPPNMLGCFIIGTFAASSTVGLTVDKSMALLPFDHPWQSNFELQIGIRTGFCGSLTTFASWFLELMVPAIQANKWMDAFLGLAVGMLAAISCYLGGLHTALAVDRWLVGDEDVLEQLEQHRSSQIQYLEGLSTGSRELSQAALMMEAEPDIPRIIASEPNELRKMHRQSHTKSPAPVQGEVAAAAGVATGSAASGRGAAVRDGPAGSGRQGRPLLDKRLSMADLGSSLRGYRTDAGALLLVVVLAALAAAGVVVEERHMWLRIIWMSVLLGPLGCVLRWFLSRFNYKLHGSWAWFPAGTFAANMLGVCIDFGLQSILQRRGTAMSYWGLVVIQSVETGFSGCLTTVSTFVTEVVKFAEAIPENYHAYRYTAMSMAGGVLAALVLFGWSVWAYD